MRLFSRRQLVAVGGALALAAWTSGAASQEEPIGQPDGKPGAVRDVYGIINLASSRTLGAGAINARGQAAFDRTAANGWPRASFFDGERIIDIGPDGAERSFAGALNERGEVTVTAYFPIPDDPGYYVIQPMRWSAARGLVALPSYNPREFSGANDINNRSEIVGSSATGDDNSSFRAVRWTATNRLLALPSPPGYGETHAYDISERNFTVGSGDDAAGVSHVLTWNAHGRVSNLGTLGKGGAAALLVNDRVDIAGTTGADWTNLSTFLWSPNRPVVHLPRGFVRNLNENGDLVGARSGPSPNDYYAFRYSRARGLVNLHPARAFASEATAVNDHGVVVGQVLDSLPSEGRALRWSPDHVATDLNTRLLNAPAGLVLNAAVQISPQGDILATSNAGVLLLRHNGGGTDAPVLGPIVMSEAIAGEPVTLSLSFSDRNLRETHTATVDWGDGSGPVPALVRERNGRGEVQAEHTYAAFGVPAVTVRVTDSARRSTETDRDVFVDGPFLQQLVGTGTLDVPLDKQRKPGLPAARTSFQLSAPLALDKDANARFLFRIQGRVTFRAERLEQVRRDGEAIRLEGTGWLDGRPGYRFALDAAPAGQSSASAGQSGASTPGRLSVRITRTDGARSMTASGAQSLADATAPFTGTLRGGTIRVKR